MGKRFTDSMILIADGMKELLDIYNLINQCSLKGEWPWKEIGSKLTRFSNTIFNSDRCFYNKAENKLAIASGYPVKRKGGSTFKFTMSQSVIVGNDELIKLVDLCDLLRNNLRENRFSHFNITNDDYHVSTEILNDSSLKNKIINTDNNLNSLKDKISIEALGKKKVITKNLSGIQIIAQPYHIYTVEILTDFAKKLLFTDPELEAPLNVQSLISISWTSFIQIVRSVFVEFHVAFNNLERIIQCTNPDCNKLSFDYHKNKRKFCGEKCKAITFKQNPKNKCRDNQNKWIRDQFYTNESISLLPATENDDPDNPYSGKKISVENCSYCVEMVSRGWCPVIRMKNQELKEILPKRKKKITPISVSQ
jgi:hypothetical protein